MSSLHPHGRRGRLYATAAAVALAVGGVIAVAAGLAAQQAAPRPQATAHPTVAAQGDPAPTHAPSPASPASRGPVLGRSLPVHLDIPAIGVHSALLQLGLNADGTVQVPPLSKDSQAGWYKYSPTPGQLGPAVVLGHIDSAKYGPGVFFRLGALRPGNTVTVTRRDGTVALFRVDRVAEYSKARFPTLDVYGNTDHAALRLITCGGKFNSSARSYQDNVIAYASLVSVRR